MDFFTKVVRNIQELFNEAYGGLLCFDKQQKFVLILSISGLCVRARKLKNSEVKDRLKIQEFMQKKAIIENKLNNIINQRRKENVERTKIGRTKQIAKAL